MAIPENPCRWVRPLPNEPGHWKRQLPAKHLKLAERGQPAAIATLLAEHPEYLNRRGSHGRTFLWSAVRHNRLELAQWLIERGADVNLTGCVNSESFVQLSPLAASHFYRRPAIYELLLRQNTQDDIFRLTYRGQHKAVFDQLRKTPSLITAEDPHDEIYYSPLMTFAIVGGHDELVNQFVDMGFDVPAYSFQLLFIGAHFGRTGMLQLFLEHGANVANADASLWMATNDLTILETLVAHGLSANQRPNGDLTPLLYACRADKGTRIDKLAFLLELGADVSAMTMDGRTPLHYAVMSGNLQACKMLIEAGVDPHQRAHKTPKPIELAQAKGFQDIAALLSS
ncbi:MAG: hypothetical protein F4W90_08045 [Gammaproteobacteria bacterium]|nr:hypothetical protein [Gammaproteobacteria bacterium]